MSTSRFTKSIAGTALPQAHSASAVIDVHSCEGPLVLLDPQLLPEDRSQLVRAVPVLSASGVDLAVLSARPADRHRTQQILADGAVFGRYAYSNMHVVNSRRWRADAQCHEHDEYFGVVRVTGSAGENFLAGLVAGFLRVLDHVDRCGTDLSDLQWKALVGLPYRVFGYASTVHAIPRAVEARPRGLVMTEESAFLRWRVGHQLYFVVIQSLAVAVSCAMRAAQEDDEAAVVDALALASLCADAAGASMRFASELPPPVYVERVRPTMLPPHVSPGFSGFQTRDHRRLVAVFRQLHAVRSHLAAVGEPYACFVNAIEDMYSAHAGVCAHFGGTSKPSLRMLALSHEQPTTSGVEVATRISRSRIGLIEPPGRCPRHG
jgi:hypothetical protein